MADDDSEKFKAYMIAFAIKLPKSLGKEGAIAASRIRRAGRSLNQRHAWVYDSLMQDLAECMERLESLMRRAQATGKPS